jgi:hypothetical protein
MDQCGSDTDGFDKSIYLMEETNTTKKRIAIGLLYCECHISFDHLEELLRSSDYKAADQLPVPTVLEKRERLASWNDNFECAG